MVKKQKGKKALKQKNALLIKENVSILTPTVKARQECLFLLADCIKNQTYYHKIKQWVIVSADKTWCEEDFNIFIEKLQIYVSKSIKIDSSYVNEKIAKKKNWTLVEDYEAIGYLRNITNLIASSEFIVCMDDDDYYPPKRVEHAVNSLRNSTKEIAGCSNHIIYETDINALFQFKRFGPNHSVNNAFAYKKSYVDSGAVYDSTKKHAEEKNFLNDYKTPMIQLEPLETIIQMVHFNNTYNKRHLLIKAEWMDEKTRNVHQISSQPHRFIPKDFLTKYRNIHSYIKSESKYDIVYYTGYGAPVWSPYDTKLGGSEQAVVYLVKCWVKMGYSVAVYGDFNNEVEIKSKEDKTNGDYYNFGQFKCSMKYKFLVIWRRYGSHPIISWPINCDNIYLDIHDNIPLTDSVINNLDKVNKIIVKSNYHAETVSNFHKGSKLLEKMKVIPNGVRVSDFRFDPSFERDLYRFCWCSCYKRGLMFILAWMWPIIKHYEPRATFHVYYGMNSVNEADFKEQMTKLLNQPGVIDHGRQSVDIIVKEKQTSTFHLYYSKTKAETDCISIRESLSIGCIPIISKHNVFEEREGIKIPGDPTNQEDHKRAASFILELLKKPEEIEKIRNEISGKESSWDDVSKLWSLPMPTNSYTKSEEFIEKADKIDENGFVHLEAPLT